MNRQHRTTALLFTMLLTVALAAATPASAAEHPTFALGSTSDTASWSGKLGTASPAGPKACTPQVCDFVPLDIQLPDKEWSQRQGGILVAIQTPYTQDWNLDLFLYGPGCGPLTCEPITSSTSPLSNEAGWIPNPVNGRYLVVVVPTFVLGQPAADAPAGPIRYRGSVKFQRGLTVQRAELNKGVDYTREFIAFGVADKQPVVELLPDLVPTTPRYFDIAWAGRGVEVPSSCLPTETVGLHDEEPPAEEPRVRCLRFDQGEYNLGDGPFQLNVYEVETGVYEVYQRIYTSDGDVSQVGPLGDVEFNDAHGHFHYLGFQHLTLYRIEADGSLTFVMEKPDKGICMVDMEMGGFGDTRTRHAPAGYPLYTEGSCVAFTHQDPNDPDYPNMPYFEMGISTGWADIYSATFPEQHLDITGVDDGDYALLVRQDVPGHITEKTTKNNTAMGCVRIVGDNADDIPCPSR